MKAEAVASVSKFFLPSMRRVVVSGMLLLALTFHSPVRAADAGFAQFIASLWPEAQAAGVSRATFDAQTSGLEPDYKLPDLILPGRPVTGAPSQAEFVQVPADYIKEASIARLATEGQRLIPLPAAEDQQQLALATVASLFPRLPRLSHSFLQIRFWDQQEVVGSPAEESLRHQGFTRDTQGLRLYRQYGVTNTEST